MTNTQLTPGLFPENVDRDQSPISQTTSPVIRDHAGSSHEAVQALVGPHLSESEGFADARKEVTIVHDRPSQFVPERFVFTPPSRPKTPVAIENTKANVATAAVGSAIGVGVLAPYVANVGAYAGVSALSGGLVSLPSGMLATMAGAPVAAGLAGAYIGKKYGRPYLGATIGAGIGAVGVNATQAFIAGTALTAGKVSATASTLYGLGTAGVTVAATAGSAAVAGAVGLGMYGLGRWSDRLRDRKGITYKKAGTVRTMLRAFRVPFDLVR